MPRCNLTLKQKSQMIELSSELNTEQLAKRFRVHPTTVTRTIKKQERILNQVARVNPNFKTVQTNFKSEQHDSLVLDYIHTKQDASEPISVNDVCDKAVEYAKGLGRQIKSKRAWWRRFKVRCNIIKSKIVKNSLGVKSQRLAADEAGVQQEQQRAQTADKPQRADLKQPKKTTTNTTATTAATTTTTTTTTSNRKNYSKAAPVIDEVDQATETVKDERDEPSSRATSSELQPAVPVSAPAQSASEPATTTPDLTQQSQIDKA